MRINSQTKMKIFFRWASIIWPPRFDALTDASEAEEFLLFLVIATTVITAKITMNRINAGRPLS